MAYLLDTNTVTSLIRASHAVVTTRIYETPVTDIVLSSVVYFEIQFGAARAKWSLKRIMSMEAVLRSYSFADLTRDDAKEAAALRADLYAMGQPIGPYDVMIAAQAKTRGLTLVTAHTKEFDLILGLQVEDWSM